MTSAEAIAIGLLSGLALGAVFFGGLWLTTKRLNRGGNAVPLMLGSFVGRSVVSLAGLFLVIRFLELPGVVGALVGLVTMQIVFLRLSAKRMTSR